MELSADPAPVIVRAARGPCIFALPHSGCHYPENLRAASRLSLRNLRRSEDAFLEQLYDWAPQLDSSLILTPFARAYIDVNRDPHEKDASLVGDIAEVAKSGERARAGLGVVPRIVGQGLDIYSGTISSSDVTQRIEQVHRPYHAALSQLIARSVSHHGFALLFDCHSMPSGRLLGRTVAPVVIGDRHGSSCAASLSHAAMAAFGAQGLRAVRNDPYAGGYTTCHYGRPDHGVHVLQIEIDRSLYMDEIGISAHGGLRPLRDGLHGVFAGLVAQADRLCATPARLGIAAE